MKIAVLTSGGDAPGMNAAIRSVVRTARARDWGVFGVQRGYEGLLGGSFVELSPRDVGGIVGAGGTILGSSRSPDFQTEEGQRTAIRRLSERDIDAIIIIGGSGSQRGAFALSQMDSLWLESLPQSTMISSVPISLSEWTLLSMSHWRQLTGSK